MTRFIPGLFAICAIFCLALAQDDVAKKNYHGDKVFRLFPITPQHHEFLLGLRHSPSSEIDFWSHVRPQGAPVDVRVAKPSIDSFKGLLNATQLPFTVAVEDVQRLIDSVDVENAKHRAKREAAAADIVGTYVSYDEIVNWARSMCGQYSALASCDTYGSSYQKRDLLYMKLGANSGDTSKKAIFLEAGMHAREWINPASTIYVVNRLLTTYNSDPTAKRLLDKWNFYVTLVSNPDGYEYSRATDRLWRKTRSQTKNGNCYGVDPNRNYDIDWAVSGSSNSACSDTYHGPYAFSESETKSISDLITLHSNEIVRFLAIHSYAQVWLVPYGYATGVKPPDYDELLRVANIGGTALMAENKQTWKIGNIADILYACSGASDDWAKIKANIKYSYPIELRPSDGTLNGFVRPESDIEPSGRELFAGLAAAIDAMISS